DDFALEPLLFRFGCEQSALQGAPQYPVALMPEFPRPTPVAGARVGQHHWRKGCIDFVMKAAETGIIPGRESHKRVGTPAVTEEPGLTRLGERNETRRLHQLETAFHCGSVRHAGPSRARPAGLMATTVPIPMPDRFTPTCRKRRFVNGWRLRCFDMSQIGSW